MHISNYTDVDLIKLSIIQCIVNFLPGYRFTSENSSMSLGWSCWWNEPDSSVQRSIWNTVHLHDWKEQKERPLLCQVHWILSNAVHSKGAVLRSHLLQSKIAKEKKHLFDYDKWWALCKIQGGIGLNVAQMIVELIRDKRKIVDRITHDQIDEFIGLLQKTQVMRILILLIIWRTYSRIDSSLANYLNDPLTSNWEMGKNKFRYIFSFLYISELSFPGFVTRPLCLWWHSYPEQPVLYRQTVDAGGTGTYFLRV